MIERPVRALLLGLLLASACGGETAATTTLTAATTTTTAPPVETTTTTLPITTTTAPPTTTTEAEGLGIDDIPPECVAAIVAMLQIYEPVVSGVDWEHATIDDHINVVYGLAGSSIDDPSAACPAATDGGTAASQEEGMALLLAVAVQEVPGVAGYFQAVIEIDQALEGRNATGDCLTDIGIFEEVVAGGIRWVDLPLHEQVLVLRLMYSIGYCRLETQGELLFRPEVQDFLEGSPFAGA